MELFGDCKSCWVTVGSIWGLYRGGIYKAGEFYSGGYIDHCACVVRTFLPPLPLDKVVKSPE